MPIHFNSSRWDEIRRTYELWWNRKLDRPLMNIKIFDAYTPDRPPPKAPLLGQGNCHDFSMSAEEVIDAIDYQLQKIEYLGDSFPCFNLDVFGPGILSAFCGAQLDNSSGRVWFFAESHLPIEEIHIKYDRENRWVKRIKDIYRAGNERWKGQVLMGMLDLGGNLDIAAIFRTSEELLTDLYDNPEEVLRLCTEIQAAWHEAYQDFNSLLRPVNPGYSDWDGLYSATPSYVLQSDFSYMIGPGMFARFVLPSIERDCELLDHTIYHLDGVGQIPHLDMLLDIENLDAVQWVYGVNAWAYGDGKPSAPHWIDLYKRIEAAGKGIHVLGSADDFFAVYEEVKNYLYYRADFSQKDRRTAEKLAAAGNESPRGGLPRV
jgi:5-methyltetrahydrofolate--homocysteine methyltransferase